MSLIDDIKAVAKEGADLQGIEGQISGLNPLSALQTKEEGFELIKSNPFLMSAFDSEMSKGVNTGVDNFKAKGMLEIIKAKEEAIRAEINPKETPEQKEIRELKDRLNSSDKEKALNTLQDELSIKAKEIGFDPILAREYSVYGDIETASAGMESMENYIQSRIKTELEAKLKGQYTKGQPQTSTALPADIDTRIMEARAAGQTDRAIKLQMVKDQQ